MPNERVLICGAGVAGSVLAFWLAKHGFQVVVVERAHSDQKVGQGIEIEEPALQVVKKMGILDKLQEKQTAEKGFNLVDEQSRSCAVFEMGRMSPTGNLELMRGDLTEVLYKAADTFPNVTYHFRTTIESLRQTQNEVIVDLVDRDSKAVKTEVFDMVVGADGFNSQTRKLAMGSPESLNCFKPIGSCVAYFSIPKEDRDWPYSRLCQYQNRRLVWLRPTGKDSNITSVYLIHVNKHAAALQQAISSGDRMKQKEAFAELFGDLGGEVPRVVKEMMKSDNFYADNLTQVKLEKWSENRVVLTGDAAWAPTPFTGQGNQLAIIGAWVLAQELSRHRSPTAFVEYEKRLRSYVESSQKIPLGGYAPYLFSPHSRFGIWAFRKLFLVISLLVRLFLWTKLESLFPEQPDHDFDLEISNDEAETDK